MKITIILSLTLLFSFTGLVYAQDVRSPDEVSRITRDVSQEILSPYCPGKTLAMCPSSSAADARREVQSMAQGGMDKEEIKMELIKRYGDEFLIVEASAEDNYTLLGAVLASFGLSVFAVAFLARRRKGKGAPSEGGLDEGPEDGGSGEADGYLEDLRAEYLD
ncbi:MAG: cytochrome c-type biogenesis protein CcmH [Bradymonadaceae bacterium]